MNLTIDQPGLGRALRLAGRIVPARPPQPVLGAVLIEAESDFLTLTATDGDLGVVATLTADVTVAGRAALPARLLGEYVAQLPTEPVHLRLDARSRRAEVRCGRSMADLATIDPEGFPTPPHTDDAQVCDLDAGQFAAAIDRVAFAAARDTSRPVLAAVLVDFQPDGLTLAAADGFRLARVRLPAVGSEARQLLVPARAVAEFGRLLADTDRARLALTPDGRGLHLIAGRTRLFTRLLEGRFPDIEPVIPGEWRTRVTVATAAFRQAVRLTGLFGASGDARPVVLDAAPGRLRLHARGDDSGEAESELPASMEGASQAVTLNTRLMVDILDAATDPQLEIAWTSADAPVVVREPGRADAADLWLVMPLYDATLARRQAEAA